MQYKSQHLLFSMRNDHNQVHDMGPFGLLVYLYKIEKVPRGIQGIFISKNVRYFYISKSTKQRHEFYVHSCVIRYNKTRAKQAPLLASKKISLRISSKFMIIIKRHLSSYYRPLDCHWPYCRRRIRLTIFDSDEMEFAVPLISLDYTLDHCRIPREWFFLIHILARRKLKTGTGIRIHAHCKCFMKTSRNSRKSQAQ